MKNTCKQCGVGFQISEEDLKFYDKVSPVISGKKFLVSPPTLCPDCRLQRRLVWRNERGLYRRKCSKTGKEMISWISPDKPYKVYTNDVWWGDNWDALDYGREFDFSRPFFDQFKELIEEVPWLGLLIDKVTNSDFVNFCLNVKNCYLTYGSNNNEDSMYSSYLTHCEDCVDVLHGDDCQLCYDSVDLVKCYSCKYSVRCNNCSDLLFCENCQNCRNCFGCVNLVAKEYHFLNESLSKAEYESKIKSLDLGAYSKVRDVKKGFLKYRLEFPKKYANILNCENCSGDSLSNSKNVHDSYDVIGAEDCRWIILGHGGIKDCYDSNGIEDLELCYETVTNGAPTSRILFSTYIWKGVHNVLYSVLSPASTDCFGVMGLHRGKYCILNKQYTKEEYEALVPRIIEHMRKTGEWGEFFPADLSPFSYNETSALDYYPLSREDALKKGFKWSDVSRDVNADNAIEVSKLPDDISDVDDNILDKVIKCELTGRSFKINSKELAYYRMYNVPLPHFHPDQRYVERMKLRNSHKLCDRKCDKCSAEIRSTYKPDRLEPVYCEKCYQEEVY